MKTVIISDVHGRSVWKLITHMENADRVIFLGDYFDSYEISAAEQIYNFQEIIDFKETSFTNSGKSDQHKTKVILLIGNHDYGYFSGIDGTKTSGYQINLAPSINIVLEENKHHMQMAYQFDKFLFTHAGVSEVFMNDIFGINEWKIENLVSDLNDLFKYKPQSFMFNTADRMGFGDYEHQSPIWIRPRSLMKAGNLDRELKKHVIQIVGHTKQDQIDIKGKATGNRYYFTDTQETSGEYLVIENGVVKIGNTR